ARRREGGRRFAAARPSALAAVVVFDAAVALLLGAEPDAEIGIEVAVERGCPRERSAHAPLVRVELRERGARPRRELHVMLLEMDEDAVEAVGDRRTREA